MAPPWSIFQAPVEATPDDDDDDYDDEDEEEEEEEPPIVKQLKVLDDKFLAFERKCSREILAIQRKYFIQQEPLLRQRAELLAQRPPEAEAKKFTGTPGLEGFWLKALQNHEELSEEIQEYDEPVLEYLQDIRYEVIYQEPVDKSWTEKGFKVVFAFAENPFFANKDLSVEWTTQEESPYTGATSAVAAKATTILWYPGKNVTVETARKSRKKAVTPKKKGAPKGKEDARSSFFRSFFRSLKQGDPVPEGITELDGLASDEEVDDEELVERLLEDSYDTGSLLRDCVIPFAVRWYTGEASDAKDDHAGGEEEEGEEEEEEEEGEEEVEELREVKFKPGEIGMELSRKTGRVTKIVKGGQAEALSLKVGMRIHSIDKTLGSRALLDAKAAGERDYTVIFEVSNAESEEDYDYGADGEQQSLSKAPSAAGEVGSAAESEAERIVRSYDTPKGGWTNVVPEWSQLTWTQRLAEVSKHRVEPVENGT